MHRTSLLSRLTFLVLFCFMSFSAAFGQGEGFPVYKDTGNPQKDAETYAAEKKAWILTHEEEYHKIPEATKQVLFFNNPSSKKEVISENTSTPKCANCEQPVQMSAKEIADKQAQSNTALRTSEVAKDENWKSAEEWAAIKLRELQNTESNRSITRKEFNRLTPNEQIEALTRQVKIKDLGTLFQNSVRWDDESSKRYIQEEDFYNLSIEEQQVVLIQKDKFEVISAKYYVRLSDLEGATEDKYKSILSDKNIVIIED